MLSCPAPAGQAGPAESGGCRATSFHVSLSLSFFLFPVDAGGEKESDNLLLKQFTTPEEQAQHRKWSMERTPMRRILQTPEQKIK